MAQGFNFGDPLVQRLFNLQARAVGAGVRSGFIISPSASPGYVDLSPGIAITPEGIVVERTAASELVFVPPAIAGTYTVCIVHSNTAEVGGSQATIEIRSGKLAALADPTPGSVAIAYIYHPGSSVPVTANMIEQVSDAEFAGFAAETLKLFMPPAQMWDLVDGADIVAANTQLGASPNAIGMILFNSAGAGSQSRSFKVRVPDNARRPKAIRAWGMLGGACTLDITLIDETGTSVVVPTAVGALGPFLVGGATELLSYEFDPADVAAMSGSAGKVMTVTVNVAAGNNCWLQQINIEY